MKTNQSGQTLIEIVVAVSIAIIVVYSLVSLATLAIFYSQSALRRSEAVKLANAGMEGFRMERDLSLDGYDDDLCLKDTSGSYTYTLKASPDLASSGCVFLDRLINTSEEVILRGNVRYRRTMLIHDTGSQKDTMVTVKWDEGSNEGPSARRVTMTGVLTNWR